MMIKWKPAVTAFGIALTSLSAQAATVTLTNILGTWFDANPAANITSNVGAGTDSTQVRWGGASGYDFDAVASGIAVVPPSPSASFVIGSFAHVNFPISAGTSITEIKLRVTADIDVDGASVGNRSFVFRFLHDETPNGADPCAYGGANGTGVNTNGCADRVQVQFADASESFLIGSDLYTVNIFGFNAGGGVVTDFLTAESARNTAQLLANVTLRRDLTVPLPGTLALAGLALAGMVVQRRRSARQTGLRLAH
jgi:PEP-CTERM motif